MEILSSKDVSVENLQFSIPKINTFGGQSIFITNNDKKLYIQTPKCYVDSGVTTFYTDFGEPRLSLKLSLDSKTQSMNLFKTFFEDFDSHNVAFGTKQSMKWFKKHLTEDVVKQLYKSQLQNNSIKLKLNCKNGKFDGDVFDKNNKEISLDSIKSGMYVKAIIECVGMYFVPNEFGVTWKAIQLKVEDPGISGYSFIDDSDQAFEEVEPTA